jgi:hypothetical protein
LWDRLAEPIDYFQVVAAMLGLSQSAVHLLQSALLATSPETEKLIAAMPSISRTMSIATTDVPERSVGSIRGPVLWSETISARAASFGDEGLFVCKSSTRAYDTAENRVLAYALWLVADAAVTVDTQRAVGHENEIADQVRLTGKVARRHLEGRTLSGVPRHHPSGRDLRRARSGRKRRTYEPAMRLLHRASVPFEPADVEAVVDDATREYHALILKIADLVEARSGTLPRFRADSGILFAGEISFRHPGHRGRSDHPAGVMVADTLLVLAGAVPDSTRRAGHDVGDILEQAQASGRKVISVGPRTNLTKIIASIDF